VKTRAFLLANVAALSVLGASVAHAAEKWEANFRRCEITKSFSVGTDEGQAFDVGKSVTWPACSARFNVLQDQRTRNHRLPSPVRANSYSASRNSSPAPIQFYRAVIESRRGGAIFVDDCL
jgi:hypothetical protein